MPDDKVTDTQPLAPVKVTVIGQGDVSGGPAPMITGTIATTPLTHQPNLVAIVVSPLLAILIRFGNNYLTILVGLIGAAMVSDVIPYTDFVNLVTKCAGLSVAGAGFSALKDMVTIFGRLETKFPLLTGSV